MFLKTEQFEYNGVSVTLSELSALQRIEHLALLKRRAEEAEASGNLQVSVEDLVRTGAFLVAMSLWHNHPQKTQSPSMNEAVMKIEQEVLTTACRCHCPGGRRGVVPVRDDRSCSSGY